MKHRVGLRTIAVLRESDFVHMGLNPTRTAHFFHATEYYREFSSAEGTARILARVVSGANGVFFSPAATFAWLQWSGLERYAYQFARFVSRTCDIRGARLSGACLTCLSRRCLLPLDTRFRSTPCRWSTSSSSTRWGSRIKTRSSSPPSSPSSSHPRTLSKVPELYMVGQLLRWFGHGADLRKQHNSHGLLAERPGAGRVRAGLLEEPHGGLHRVAHHPQRPHHQLPDRLQRRSREDEDCRTWARS